MDAEQKEAARAERYARAEAAYTVTRLRLLVATATLCGMGLLLLPLSRPLGWLLVAGACVCAVWNMTVKKPRT